MFEGVFYLLKDGKLHFCYITRCVSGRGDFYLINIFTNTKNLKCLHLYIWVFVCFVTSCLVWQQRHAFKKAQNTIGIMRFSKFANIFCEKQLLLWTCWANTKYIVLVTLWFVYMLWGINAIVIWFCEIEWCFYA